MKKLIDYLNYKRKNLKKNLPLHELKFQEDFQEVFKGLKTGYVSTAGKDILTFEKKLKKLSKQKI